MGYRTNFNKLTESDTAVSVYGAIMPTKPRIIEKHYPRTAKEWFVHLCEHEDDENTVLQFYPYKVVISKTKEKEMKKIYSDFINFNDDTVRISKGDDDGALYFRYENQATLIKLVA